MFTLASPVMADLGIMPDKYTATPKGQNMSPPLSWADKPTNVRSFALAMVDLDVPWGKNVGGMQLPPPGFLPADILAHWLVYNIDRNLNSVAEGVKGLTTLNNNCQEFGMANMQSGYLGPMPPAGDRAHEYVFSLYALSKDKLELPAGARYPEFMAAIAAAGVLGVARLTVYCAQKA